VPGAVNLMMSQKSAREGELGRSGWERSEE